MGVIESGKSRLDNLRERFAERIAMRLFDQVTNNAVSKPGRGAARWAAYAIAAVVHLCTLGCAGFGLWLIFGLGGFGFILCGVVLVGLAILTRPRLGRLPRDAVVIDPATAPRLYELVGRVARQLGARPVWRIVLAADCNAAYSQVGFRRRRVLWIGYALWNLLDPSERMALLGHELGHGVNGDARRGLVVGSSLDSLREIYILLRQGPRREVASSTLLIAFGEWVARIIMRVLSWPVLGVFLVQERLLAQSGQRAEYYADQLAVRAAGSRAVMSMLDTLRLSAPCMRALHTSVIRRDPDIWAASRTWRAELSEAERASMIERAESERHRVDASHPPTGMRIAAVDSRPDAEDVLRLDQDEADAIDAELRPLLRPVTEVVRAAAIG